MSGTESPDFDRSTESKQVLDEARQDREEIKRLKAWVSDLQSGMYVNCVYCGHRYGPRETTPVTMADALKAHVAECPKHPMSALLAVAIELRTMVHFDPKKWDDGRSVFDEVLGHLDAALAEFKPKVKA